jgi:hypothetical protein
MFIAPGVEMKTKTPTREDSFLPGTVFLISFKNLLQRYMHFNCYQSSGSPKTMTLVNKLAAHYALPLPRNNSKNL